MAPGPQPLTSLHHHRRIYELRVCLESVHLQLLCSFHSLPRIADTLGGQPGLTAVARVVGLAADADAERRFEEKDAVRRAHPFSAGMP